MLKVFFERCGIGEQPCIVKALCLCIGFEDSDGFLCVFDGLLVVAGIGKSYGLITENGGVSDAVFLHLLNPLVDTLSVFLCFDDISGERVIDDEVVHGLYISRFIFRQYFYGQLSQCNGIFSVSRSIA